MDYSFTPEQEAFRKEIREFCQENMNPEVMSDGILVGLGGGADMYSRNFHKKMAEKGWLGLGWPKEYGGGARDFMDMAMFMEETAYWRAPMAAYGTTVVFIGNAIMHFGSEEQKKEILPKIISGDVTCTLGYTEPNAGSDLASLQLRAVADGDDYVLNGQKVFNTAAHYASHYFMATRTDINAPKHRGISLFLYPMRDIPGLTIRPLYTSAGGRTNEVFAENVRIPKSMMVGELNRGWYHLATALDFERVGIGSAVGGIQRSLDDTVAYLKGPGSAQRHNPIIRRYIAETAIDLDALRNWIYMIAWMQNHGLIPSNEGSAVKILASELQVRLAQGAMRLFGELGLLREEEANHRQLPLANDVSTFYMATSASTALAGSTEIQQGIIAMRGLGLPRSY